MRHSLSIALSVTLLAAAATAVPGSTAEPAPVREPADAGIESGPGKVLPLAQILAAARRMVPGKVIDVELESDVGIDEKKPRPPRWVYEVEILTVRNQVVELEFDAKTGQLLEIEGAPWPAGVPKPKP